MEGERGKNERRKGAAPKPWCCESSVPHRELWRKDTLIMIRKCRRASAVPIDFSPFPQIWEFTEEAVVDQQRGKRLKGEKGNEVTVGSKFSIGSAFAHVTPSHRQSSPASSRSS
jgi:hypothetical protein